MTSAASPYIDDKPAWQRLLISAAGVLCNIATFLILYFILPHISSESTNFLWPLIAWSLILAIINILPIYPLDGGAIVFALYEIITGKKPSPTFTNVCGWIGFIFIILFFWVFPEWLGGIIERVFDMLF
ncbi:MAG: site-2 protease family protein [Prevotella sp.]|nr:site-2 protease family protein [Prevotella sp.]